MRLVLFTLPVAVVLGYVLGGRLGQVGTIRIRYGWAGLAGVALQFLPVDGTAGYLVLVASFLLLLFVCGANLWLPGFLLLLIGLSMNFLVIVVNEGMPVTREAITSSGQSDTLESIEASGGNKHHLATSEDQLLFLADRVALPSPVKQAVSVGDIVAYAGAMWFIVAGMRRRDEAATMEPQAQPAEALT